ncbi:MAG TPA: hypothetical protein VFP21_03475, partial [Solirubrobacterales bacterium]|nr:hypothetical protein [Solirubrobacterales bacterium]
GNSQLPSEYEDLSGVKHQAIPMAEVNAEPPDTSGVELTFAIQPSVPLEIKAVSAAEIEAKQRAEETAKKRQEEEAAAKKRQEDEAAAKKHQEEEAAAIAAKRHREEVARKRHLGKALAQCKKVKPGPKRARCVKRAHKKYGVQKIVKV